MMESLKEKIQYFNSREAAEILGVNVSTIKRWTESGKLKCIKTAGGHRKFLMEHLIDFVETHKKYAEKVSLFPVENEDDVRLSMHIVKRHYDELQSYLLEKAFQGLRKDIQRILNGLYLADVPLYEIYDKLISPVLVKVGELWEKGDISIAMEHLASQSIKDAMIQLQGIIQVPRQKRGKVLCLNMSDELHDIPLKMIDHLLELKGYHTLFTGQITPTLRLEEIFQKFRPERVYISSTYIQDIERTREEFERICDMAMAFDAEVYTAGQGFRQLRPSHPAIRKFITSYQDVFED